MALLRHLGMLLLVGLLGGLGALPMVAQSAPAGFLHVDGRLILDGSGQAVLLRGVNVDTDYWRFPFDPQAPLRYATVADMQTLAEKGTTAIRLALSWQYFDTPMGYQLVDDYLTWCEAAGVYVILDMHVVPPDAEFGMGSIWDDATAQARFVALWVDLATRYRERTIIAGYDLFNEPVPPEVSQWWDLARRTSAAIRAVDPAHILFVEDPNQGDPAVFQLIDDANVVYSFHDYSPFSVTHAGAGWVGDTPMPTNDSYPGPVLKSVDWLDYSQDNGELTEQSADWLYWESQIMTPPAGADWASVKPYAWGDVGTVSFDDLVLLKNGVEQPIHNASFEDAANDHPNQPATWFFYGQGDFSGLWATTAHSGERSVQLSGSTDYGVWNQSNWILTAPLFPISAGDTFQLRGWILAPDNHGGAGLGLDYLKSSYEVYDRQHLQADMQRYLDWGAAHNVPLYVGEFGAMALSPGDSRYNLIQDKVSVMNENGLHWSMWSFRDTDGVASFGLYQADQIDERLAAILQQGMKR